MSRVMCKLKGCTLLAAGLMMLMLPAGDFVPNNAFAQPSAWDRDGLTMELSAAPTSWQLPAKKSCAEFYPLPDGYDRFTGCRLKGQSVCGGPQQCSCKSNEALVTYQCDQQAYNICKADASCN